MMRYRLEINGSRKIVDCRRQLYFLVVKALLEVFHIQRDDLPPQCDVFSIGEYAPDDPDPPIEELKQLIRNRPNVVPTRNDPRRYRPGYGAIKVNLQRYLLYNQDSDLRLPSVLELARQRNFAISWDKVVGGQQGEDQGNHNLGNNMELCPNVILYGPPGTGKTFATLSIAAQIPGVDHENNNTWKVFADTAAGEDEEAREKRREVFERNLGRRIHFITFHQSYSYEDFIGGLRRMARS